MATKRKSGKQAGEPVAAELGAIKRLLILQLITSGVQSKDIATALGVDGSVISRIVSKHKVKRPTGR